MVSLEEYNKICNLLSSCNDMIDGKFILVNYKIANILKHITESKDVYNLIANCMNDFNFEREFSKAQIRTNSSKRFKLPEEAEKVLPLIFCILVSINNKSINFDAFLKEFFHSDKGPAQEYLNFASAIILPFRNIIADYFEIAIEEINANLITKNEILETKLDDIIEDESLNEEEKTNEENLLEESLTYDEDWNYDLEEENNNDENFVSNEKLTMFLSEVKEVCQEIKSVLDVEKRINKSLKENILYITDVIIANCENQDIKNVTALIISYEYITASVKSIKLLSKQLKNLLVEIFN